MKLYSGKMAVSDSWPRKEDSEADNRACDAVLGPTALQKVQTV